MRKTKLKNSVPISKRKTLKIEKQKSSYFTFSDQVLVVVKVIPKGRVLSYKQVASLSGRPGAWRAVGNLLNKNHDLAIPCHRVIKSSGEIGGYNGGSERKRFLLEREGFKFNS